MELFLAVLVALFSISASAQDSRGRDRRPPSSGGGSSSSGGSSSAGSRDRGSSPSGGSVSRGGSDRPSEPARAGGDRGSSGVGTARRRVPNDRPDQGTIDGIRWRSGEPDRRPPAGPNGEPLGRAVRRDSLPPRDVGGVDVERHRNERERGRYYWHYYNGYRYCHYVDHYGHDWYFWYHGDEYWEMQYHSGRWWRYDARYGRWCYLHHGHWYWHDGPRVYVYREERNDYVEAIGSGDGDVAGEVAAPDWSVTGNLGISSLKPVGSRGAGDVLEENAAFLDFDGQGFKSLSYGVEVNRGLGRHAEASLGVGFFRGSADSRYTDYVHESGAEITQRLTVTNVPVSATVKVMPWGRDQRIQPYVGGGVQLNNWRYSEAGQFIDFNSPDYDIYRESYAAKGTSAGPVALAGIRVPIDRERAAVGVEYRHSWAQGRLPKEGGFAGDRLDLGGGTLNVGLTISLDRKK